MIRGLTSREKVYAFLMVLFVAVVIVLSVMKELFWLNLISTFLALFSGALGSLTRTVEEKNGRSRLARAGRMLLGLTILSALTAVVTAYVQKEDDRRTDRQREAEFQDQQRRIGGLNKELSEANRNLQVANEKLDSQIRISLDQARALTLVGSELHAERTRIRSAELSWNLWVKPKGDSECLSEFVDLSEEPFKKAEATRPEAEKLARGVTKSFPDLSLFSERCSAVLSDTFEGQNSVVIHFYKTKDELTAMEQTSFSQGDALRFGRGWTLRLYSNRGYPVGNYFRWIPSRGLLTYQENMEVSEEDFKRPDGTSVSLFDLSDSQVSIKFGHSAHGINLEDYGIEMMTIVFNRWVPYAFGSQSNCPKCIPFSSEHPASRNPFRGPASYKAVLPTIRN